MGLLKTIALAPEGNGETVYSLCHFRFFFFFGFLLGVSGIQLLFYGCL